MRDTVPINQIAEELGIPRATVNRFLSPDAVVTKFHLYAAMMLAAKFGKTMEEAFTLEETEPQRAE